MPRAKANASSEKLRKKIRGGKKRSALKKFLFIFVLSAATVAAFLFLASRYIFKIAKFEINDSYRYSDTEILAAGGLSEGMELYAIPVSQTEQYIKENLPYVKSAKLIKIPPSTLRINITLEKGVLGTKLGGDYYILSENFRVLEKISATEEPEKNIIGRLIADDIIIFKTNSVKECYVGKDIKFQDSDISDFLSEVLEVVEEYQINGIIREIDITNKFAVTMNCSDRFLVKIDSFEDIGQKILSSILMINDLYEDDKGKLERIDDKVWSFIPDDKIFS